MEKQRKVDTKYTPRPSLTEIKEIFHINFPNSVASNTKEKLKVIA